MKKIATIGRMGAHDRAIPHLWPGIENAYRCPVRAVTPAIAAASGFSNTDPPRTPDSGAVRPNTSASRIRNVY